MDKEFEQTLGDGKGDGEGKPGELWSMGCKEFRLSNWNTNRQQLAQRSLGTVFRRKVYQPLDLEGQPISFSEPKNNERVPLPSHHVKEGPFP